VLICPTCEGKKVLKIGLAVELCPKCNGKGKIESTVKEQRELDQTILHG